MNIENVTYNEVLTVDGRIYTFMTDGDPYFTARSMGKYAWIKSTKLPKSDGSEPTKECNGKSPQEAADELYSELSDRVMTPREHEEHGRVGNAVPRVSVDDVPRVNLFDRQLSKFFGGFFGKGDKP